VVDLKYDDENLINNEWGGFFNHFLGGTMFCNNNDDVK